ncbi:hypothetical protein [Enterococcus innesii]|uniref:hypothetical protein n=1 Tax=Enterococcus innesii TaxID=2839759 RepID=UPI003F82951E
MSNQGFFLLLKYWLFPCGCHLESKQSHFIVRKFKIIVCFSFDLKKTLSANAYSLLDIITLDTKEILPKTGNRLNDIQCYNGLDRIVIIEKKFRKFVDKCFSKGYIGKQLQERYYF